MNGLIKFAWAFVHTRIQSSRINLNWQQKSKFNLNNAIRSEQQQQMKNSIQSNEVNRIFDAQNFICFFMTLNWILCAHNIYLNIFLSLSLFCLNLIFSIKLNWIGCSEHHVLKWLVFVQYVFYTLYKSRLLQQKNQYLPEANYSHHWNNQMCTQKLLI